MSDDTYSLRPEAGPVPYWKHHKRAKEALKLIIRALTAAAETVQVGKGLAGDPSIDTNRASRIFFVSGEPGSGKSTMYLTLRAMLNSKNGEVYSEECPPDLGLEKLRGAVRLLDPLDLEVAADEGENLLAAVLVRLFGSLESTGTVHSNNCEDAIKELEELASDIGIAWEGNLQARAGALDPATYSEEVIRTQRARLGVNDRLRSALDKIAEKECYGCKPNTLFVLPVDDLYLKPAISLQLLRLLRMISIPRLFFLVMGDITTVEALFIEKSLADWTDVAGSRLFADRSERLDEALSRARELRARYLRKLLPPGQRAMIEPMDWYEALDFEITHPEATSAQTDTLEKWLGEVTLDKPTEPDSERNSGSNLLNFLISPPFTDEEKRRRKERAKKDDKTEETKDERMLRENRAAYTALQILDATPREMMDLGAALRGVKRSQTSKESGNEGSSNNPFLLSKVVDLVILIKDEQNFLSAQAQKIVEGVLPTRRYSPDDVNFSMDRLCLQPAPQTWRKQNQLRLWVRSHRSWDLTANRELITDSNNKDIGQNEAKDTDQATKDPFAKLPPRPAAWFVLLHDLASEWKPDSVNKNLVRKLCEDLKDWELKDTGEEAIPGQDNESKPKQRFITREKQNRNIDPSEHFIGWAVISRDGSSYEHFPMPDFKTFRELDQFLLVWNRGLEWLKEDSKQAQAGINDAYEQRELVRVDDEKTILHDKDVDGEKDAEAITTVKAAEPQKQAEVEDAQKQADEARGRDNETESINQIVRLWSVAGSTIIDGQFEEFARSGNDWFKDALKAIQTDNDTNQKSKNWREKVERFRSKMVSP